MNHLPGLCTVGYGGWTTKTRTAKLLKLLTGVGIDLLIDIRHSPCASNLDPAHQYGPRDWNLQADGGIVDVLAAANIGYLWLVELGNPQRQDPEMRVLRRHLSEPENGWPVHRGLAELRHLVCEERQRCCLLCACKDYDDCHRKLLAEAFRDSLSTDLTLIELTPRRRKSGRSV